MDPTASPRPTPPVIRAGLHLRHGHRQDQRDRPARKRTPLGWWAGFAVAFLFAMLLFVSLSYLVVKGHRHLGQQPARSGWAFDITNFVWWIGIGHAGTLISAILLLLQAEAGARRSTASPKR